MSGSKKSSVKRRIVWIVEDFTKENFEKYKEKNDLLYTDYFDISIGSNRTIWDLSIGLTEEKDVEEYCILYLHKFVYDEDDEVDDVLIKFNASIQKSNGELLHLMEFEKKSSWFKSNLWKFAPLMKFDEISENNPYIVDDQITFIMDLELINTNGLKKLTSMCLESLIKNLSKENVFENLILADRLNEKVLMEECIKFIKKNFNDLRKCDGWKNLGQELLMKIMESMNYHKIVDISLISSLLRNHY